MMGSIHEIERLAVRARKDVPPPVDVLPGVMRRVRREAPESLRPLAWIAAGSVAMAVACVAVVAPILETLSDPASVFFQFPLGGP